MKTNISRFLLALSLFIWTSSTIATTNKIIVGTTGDYPPLTEKVNGHFEGQDIDIIKAFAKDTNKTIEFKETSWLTLSNDLMAGKFDLAVGGISDNASRRAKFYLSKAMEYSTKVPMVRCADAKKFTSLEAIDTEQIKVIENRGGTNQTAALNNIKNATIILVPQNAKAIAGLTSKPTIADVMFTDDIEANYRHKINPLLCIAPINKELMPSNKVYIFTKNKSGRHLCYEFNTWRRNHVILSEKAKPNTK